jgi:hypothetical protein
MHRRNAGVTEAPPVARTCTPDNAE